MRNVVSKGVQLSHMFPAECRVNNSAYKIGCRLLGLHRDGPFNHQVDCVVVPFKIQLCGTQDR